MYINGKIQILKILFKKNSGAILSIVTTQNSVRSEDGQNGEFTFWGSRKTNLFIFFK